MVLEDAAATPEFVSDSSPTSDNDPYSTPSNDVDTITSGSAAAVHIDIREFPRPLPILGPLFGYTASYTMRQIEQRILASATILKRPVTSDEGTALAFWTARRIAITSLGSPLGACWGSYRAWSTRANYKFPFGKPNADGSYIRDPNTFAGGAIRGRQAQLMWHIARFAAYGSWGGFLAGLFVSTYGAVVAAVGEQQDPRLQDLVKAIRSSVRQGMSEARGMGRRQPVGHAGDPTGQGQTSMPELWKKHRDAIGDDASPTGGYNDTEPADGATLSQSGDDILSDQQMRTQEQQQQASPGKSRTENRASTFEIEKVAPQPSSFDDLEDTSPTAGQGPTNAVSGGDSAWARIRNQASSNGSTRASKRMSSTQEERTDGSTTGDSFAFSETESDKQLAKDEAQREFDERVERERRGGDFGAGRRGP